MLFIDAISLLDDNGLKAVKRPAMRGYVFKNAAQAEDGSECRTLTVVDASGAAVDIVLGENGEVESVRGDIVFTATSFYAFALASDWEVAVRAEYEKARVGTGEM